MTSATDLLPVLLGSLSSSAVVGWLALRVVKGIDDNFLTLHRRLDKVDGWRGQVDQTLAVLLDRNARHRSEDPTA